MRCELRLMSCKQASALASAMSVLTPLELRLVQMIAKVDDALAQGVPAGMLAEHEVGLRQADVLGVHDLISRALLEHAVLVDARLVREGVLADDRLVALDLDAGDVRHE